MYPGPDSDSTFLCIRKTTYMIKRLLFSLLTLFSLGYAFAQETTSQIEGTVVTDSKAGLSGATVVALHTPTGTKYTTTTRKDGRFNIPGLRVGGPYTLTITYVGFKEEKQENIYLVLGQDFTSDFTMIPEAKELQATIVSAARQNKIFNNAHTGAQEIITRAQLEQLPTINRSMQDFARLEPSATGGSGGVSFSGTNPGMNNITVDGADFNNSFGLSGTLGGQASAQPIALDAVDQIQVNIAPYDVREGGFTGAGVNSVTRQGTNQFRGTVYDYIKSPSTIGYKADVNQVARTPFSYKVLGGSLGGAFIPDRLFFFVNVEEDLQTAPSTSVIPSTAANPPIAGVVAQANADTLTEIANYLKNTYNYNPGSFQSYSFQTNSYKINARLDFNINKSNVLTLKYNYLKSYTDQFASTSRPGSASGQVTGGQPGTYSIPFSGSGYRINNNLGIWIAELNTRFGNSASNKIQLGYTRERDFRTPKSSSPDFPLVDILNNGNIYTTFGYEPYTYNNTLNMDSYQFTDVVSIFKGAHEITLGTQDSYKKYQNAFAPGWNGGYQFSSVDAFLSGAPAQNYYQSYSTLKGGAFPWAYAGATNLSFFAQDKWRATPTFTLTYGVRVDYTDYQNKFTDNPAFDNLTFANGSTYNIGKAPEGFLVVSPRVGFNWDITGDRTWQLRGGAGIFEGAPPFVWIENQAANNGVQFGSYTLTSTTNPKAPTFFPTAAGGLNYYLSNSGQTQTSTPFGYSTDVTAKNFKYPTKLRSSVALDKKLPDSWIVTGEFTYSKDINATYMENLNLNETNEFQLNNGGDTRERYLTTTTGSNKYYYQGTSLPSPNIGTAILLANTSKGYSYTATARIQKTWTNLTASIAYTYSQTMTAMENGSTASSLWSARAVANTNPNAPTLAHPSWYQPHRVIATANYRVSYAKHFATSVGAIYEAAPGGVTSYVYNGDLNGDGNTGNDLIYIPKSASDIHLVDVGSVGTKAGQSTTGITTGTTSDPRTAAQIWNQLNDFINQDPYLYKRKGEYAKANSVVEPWVKRLDLNVTEDIYFYSGKGDKKDKHTLRLSLDLVNAGNFLKFEGMSTDGKTPLFSFPFSDAANLIPFQSSFATATSNTTYPAVYQYARWQMQFGIRYMFN
jgi:hypothetical protein